MMDFSQIKKFVKQNGDKFILIENGEPEMVVMSFQEYQKLAADPGQARMPSRPSSPRAEYADFSTESSKETEFMFAGDRTPSGPPVRLEDIRLEDLPI